MNTEQRRLYGSIATPLLVLAVLCCITGAMAGGLASMFYVKDNAEPVMGMTFQTLRPLHTSLLVCWIFLAGIACVYHYLVKEHTDRFREVLGMARLGIHLWILAGVCLTITILMGWYSGREYLAFSPIISVPIFIGWLIFAANFIRLNRGNYRGKPVYFWMWMVSLGLFTWSFTEGHLYLIPQIGSKPLLDMAIQWKSYGALVGSFNLLVYGTLLYIACKIKGCEKYAFCNLCYALFFVGILNSFTNFGHHTYHLPQSHVVKWISFIVSMLEIVILAKVFWDVLGVMRSMKEASKRITTLLFAFGTMWTFIQLFVSLLISIPPLNGFIHGTQVVIGHSMGTMIGIDSMILWGAGFFLIANYKPEVAASFERRSIRFWVIVLNVFLTCFWLTLTVKGLIFGWERYTQTSGYWMANFDRLFPKLFVVFGMGLLISMIGLLVPWVVAFVPKLSKKPVRSSKNNLEQSHAGAS